MPNWDRVCTQCGFTGSWMDFVPTERRVAGTLQIAEPEDQRCVQTEDCGKTVEWRDE